LPPGGGFTGTGDPSLASRAAVSLTREGEIRVLAASTEIGQGTTTLFAQMVAGVLGVAENDVIVETPDTGKVPNSGPTVASRTCMIVGGLLERAARQLRDEIARCVGRLPRSPKEWKDAGRGVCGRERARPFEG